MSRTRLSIGGVCLAVALIGASSVVFGQDPKNSKSAQELLRDARQSNDRDRSIKPESAYVILTGEDLWRD